MVLDVNHHTVESNDDGPPSLRVAVCHRKELTLSHGLSAADVYQDTEPLQKLLHGGLVTGRCALPPRPSAGRLIALDDENPTQLFRSFNCFRQSGFCATKNRRVVSVLGEVSTDGVDVDAIFEETRAHSTEALETEHQIIVKELITLLILGCK